MKSVYKYPIPAADIFTLEMPAGALLLDVQEQRGTPCLWALVDPEKKGEPRTFYHLGTGHPGPAVVGPHVGTYQLAEGALVFHVFEKEAERPQEV